MLFNKHIHLIPVKCSGLLTPLRKLGFITCLKPCIFCIGFEYLENLQSSQTEEAQDHELVEFENLVFLHTSQTYQFCQDHLSHV